MQTSYYIIRDLTYLSDFFRPQKESILNCNDFFYILPEIQLIFFICINLIYFSFLLSNENKKYISLLNITNAISIFGLVLIFTFLKYYVIVNTSIYIFSFFVILSMASRVLIVVSYPQRSFNTSIFTA